MENNYENNRDNISDTTTQNIFENNIAEVSGIVASELEFNHTVYGESFYSFILSVSRLSGASDKIRVVASERLLSDVPCKVGDYIDIKGQFRSYNNYVNPGSKLVLSVFAKDLSYADPEENKNPNMLYLNGFLCKEPVYRTTPFGREIADILLAVNRTYNKSDYIPVIAWGRNARFCRNFRVGDNIKIWGRIQSREYQKKISEGETVTKVAYEVSVSRLELCNRSAFQINEENESVE